MEQLLEKLGIFCEKLEKQKSLASEKYEEARKNALAKRDEYNSAQELALRFRELERAEKELSECAEAEEEIRRHSG